MLGPSRRLIIVCIGIIAFGVLPIVAQEKERGLRGTPVLWREPVDIESRDLFLGAGGEAMKPDLSRVTYVEKKKGGTSTKYRVRDGQGQEWIAKLGKEPQAETAANRLIWALGYETEIGYLAPRLTIEGKGTFENVRLEARPKNVDRVGDWEWENNPFLGTPELQGLKILMVLMNNWDIKDSNNEIIAPLQPAGSELRYIISDLGATFGKTGGFFSRTRNKPSDFIKADFIKSVEGDVVEFNYDGKEQKLFKDIKLADVRWIVNWLERLSDNQIKDAFRAGNYTPEQVEALSAALRRRIETLGAVSRPATVNR